MISEFVKIYQGGQEIAQRSNAFYLRKEPFYIQSLGSLKSPSVGVSNQENFNNFLLKQNLMECWTRDGDAQARSAFELCMFRDEAIEICSDEPSRDKFAALLAREAVPLLRKKVADTPALVTAISIGRNYFSDFDGKHLAIFSFFSKERGEVPISHFPDNQVFMTYFGNSEETSISDQFKLNISRTRIEGFKILF